MSAAAKDKLIALTLALMLGEVFWFGMLYPLLPNTGAGWLVDIAAGALTGLWAGGSALAMGWLQRQSRFQILCKLLGACIAVSLGVGIFILALHGQEFVAKNFSYFGR